MCDCFVDRPPLASFAAATAVQQTGGKRVALEASLAVTLARAATRQCLWTNFTFPLGWG